MQKKSKKLSFRYLLILFFSLVLLLAQTNRLHMHVDSHGNSTATGDVVAKHVITEHTVAHSALTLHNHGDSHHHGYVDNNHPVTIDVSPDDFIKKINSLPPLLLVLFFFGLSLIIPRSIYIVRQKSYKILFTFCPYLFQPPLRAPPVK